MEGDTIMVDPSLKRSIILDNYENPRNKEVPKEEGYQMTNSRNHSCIDNIDIYLKIENNTIKDVKYEGEACVICISSSSILSNILIGKTLEEAQNIIDNYNKMINEEPCNINILEEAQVYNDVGKQPSRKGCATLFIKGVEKIITK